MFCAVLCEVRRQFEVRGQSLSAVLRSDVAFVWSFCREVVFWRYSRGCGESPGPAHTSFQPTTEHPQLAHASCCLALARLWFTLASHPLSLSSSPPLPSSVSLSPPSPRSLSAVGEIPLLRVSKGRGAVWGWVVRVCWSGGWGPVVVRFIFLTWRCGV